MSYADEVFINLEKTILESPFTDIDENVRPKWEDGAPAHTRKAFGICNKYDLSKEFPLLTLRPVPFHKAVDEILWIYQRKSNNINDLGSKIWDQWADAAGSIGEAYGAQVAKKSLYKIDGQDVYMDQMDAALYDLKNNHASRRIIINLYNHQDLHAMHLHPCCFLLNFNVTGEYLNLVLMQRSLDTFVAQAWNVAQYAALLMMVAQATGHKPGIFMHVVTDAHIYDRHEPLVIEMLEREPLPAAKVTLNPDKKDFYSFVPEDFIVEGYQTHSQFKGIPVAI